MRVKYRDRRKGKEIFWAIHRYVQIYNKNTNRNPLIVIVRMCVKIYKRGVKVKNSQMEQDTIISRHIIKCLRLIIDKEI